jgi:cytochrome c biogenesis protein CcdA
MPVAIAIVAGALGALNPCGFPLLPAFLSLYVGADEDTLPRAPTRVAQGLVVGLLVTVGFVGTFALASVPISLAGGKLTRAIPWTGLLLGSSVIALGAWTLVGRGLSFYPARNVTVSRARRPLAIVGFGAAYALCSVGCTLPVFLAVIGASFATATVAETAAVFGAYGLGMGTLLMALSVATALLRGGLASRLKRVLPHMHRVAGVLLILTGGYLTYYWARVLWAPPDSLGTDPLVGAVSRFTSWMQATAASSGGRALVLAAGLVVAVALGWSLWRWTSPHPRLAAATRRGTATVEERAGR